MAQYSMRRFHIRSAHRAMDFESGQKPMDERRFQAISSLGPSAVIMYALTLRSQHVLRSHFGLVGDFGRRVNR